jgi:hypothetical protein
VKFAALPLGHSPRTLTAPLSGGSPEATRSRVVLPAPVRPVSTDDRTRGEVQVDPVADGRRFAVRSRRDTVELQGRRHGVVDHQP